MNIEVYCDESYPDLFCSASPQARFLLIGSLWLEREKRDLYKQEIHALRDRHKLGGEFKWTKISPSKIEFYKDLVSWFHSYGNALRFRCIAMDRERIDLLRFHQNDQELGFYKFYYQVLHHWIHSLNSYSIYCDYKRNWSAGRLRVLRDCLVRSNLSANIEKIQFVRSRESVLIQLSDVLTGISAARLNGRFVDTAGEQATAKEEVALLLERLLERKIAPTPLHEKKFNVFKINLRGGW